MYFSIGYGGCNCDYIVNCNFDFPVVTYIDSDLSMPSDSDFLFYCYYFYNALRFKCWG